MPRAEQMVDATELFDHVINDLPLEGCFAERHPFTGRLEFVAPLGYAFEMGGEFHVSSETNDGSHLMNMPMESQGLRVKNMQVYPERYEDDDSYPYNWYEPPASFRGPRIAIFIDGLTYGDVIYPSQLEALRDQTTEVEISIVGPIDGSAEQGSGEYVWEDPPGSGMYRPDFYPSNQYYIHWEFEEALGKLGAIELKVIEDNSGPPSLKIVSSQRKPDEIWVPKGRGMTSDMFVSVMGMSGKKIPEEDLIEYMRHKRLNGDPLADDPLRHLKIIVANDKEVLLPVETLAEQAINRPKSPRSHAEAIAMQEQSLDEHFRRQRAEKLKGTLAVIKQPGPLADIVDAHAGENWLEEELDRQSRYNIAF